MKVLVIEDDRSVRETLGIVLESYDIEVSLVEGGDQALELLRNQWPDVLLLDLSLNGMTGEEVFNRIYQEFGMVPPTVVLSAVSHGEKRLRNMPGARFLAKPYTLDQLIGIIREVHAASKAA